MNTHGGDGAVFRWNFSAFLVRSAGVEIFSGLYNFLDVLPTRCTETRLLSSIPPTQLTRYFLWGILGSCLLYETDAYLNMLPTQLTRHFRMGTFVFTLGNSCTSCYVTHATYAPYQRNLLVAIQKLISYNLANKRIWTNKKMQLKKMQWNIKKRVRIRIRHSEMN